MELKFVLFTLLSLFATCGSIETNRFASPGSSNHPRNAANSALRPWGTVPSPVQNHGNPATLSPLRPFGAVPTSSSYQPPGIPRHPVPTPYHGRPAYMYRNLHSSRRLEPGHSAAFEPVVSSDPGVTSPPISTTKSSIGNEPGVTLPPPYATERMRSSDRAGGNSPKLYPSLAYFERNGYSNEGEETTTTSASGVLNRGLNK